MSEGNPFSPASVPPSTEEWENTALREVTWSELVLRIAASRNIRRQAREWEASFDAGFARRIAAQSKRIVNPDDLTLGKQATSTGVHAPLEHFAPRGCE